jgi:prophage maintenance system killer protein
MCSHRETFARSHPYNDGNNRVAFMVMAVFLGLEEPERQQSARAAVYPWVAADLGWRAVSRPG